MLSANQQQGPDQPITGQGKGKAMEMVASLLVMVPWQCMTINFKGGAFKGAVKFRFPSPKSMTPPSMA